MVSKSKGAEHRLLLKRNAAEMLYARGYNNTSLRDLAALSGDNVAIFNYYFGSKASLAFEIYADTVNACDQQLCKIYDLTPMDEFILFNLAELCLCFQSSSFEKLYTELYQGQTNFIVGTRNNFINMLQTHHPERDPAQIILSALNITHLKPSIVTYHQDRAVMKMHQDLPISEETLLHYYAEQLLLTFEGNTERTSHFLSLISHLTFDLSSNMEVQVRMTEG